MNIADLPRKKRPTSAAQWDARLRSADCTAADRAAFDSWLGQSADNAASYDLLQHKLELLRQASTNSHAGIEAIRARALESLATPPARSRRPMWFAAIAASLLALIGGTAYLTMPGVAPGTMAQRASPVVIAAGAGERRTVRLSDGSQITLNARTRIEVSFETGRRLVRLREGEALFKVAKDPSRPFSVLSDGPMVTAVGTAFSVRQDIGRFQVVMQEGKVKVGPAGSPESLMIVQGQRLRVRPGLAMRVDNVDLLKELAWLEGRVIFEDEPLSSAVASMSRYLPAPLKVGDPALGRLRINGMFRTDRPEAFISALSDLYQIEVRPAASGDGQMLVRR